MRWDSLFTSGAWFYKHQLTDMSSKTKKKQTYIVGHRILEKIDHTDNLDSLAEEEPIGGYSYFNIKL